MSANAITADATILPPMSTGARKPQQFSSTSTPTEKGLWTGLGADAPKGWVYITVKAVGVACRFWFKDAIAGSATLTSSTGTYLEAGDREYFWVHGTLMPAFDVYSASNAVLEITISSDEYNTAGKGRVLP